MSTKFRERFQNVQRRPNFRWTHSVQMPVYHCVSQVWGIKNWYRLWDVGLVLVPVFSFQFAALYVVGSIILCSAIVLWKTFAKFYWHLCCCLLTGDAGRAGRGWHSWTNSPKLESKHHIADNVVYLFGCRSMMVSDPPSKIQWQRTACPLHSSVITSSSKNGLDNHCHICWWLSKIKLCV